MLVGKIQGKRLVLVLLHDLTLARALVVDATEVQDAMDDDAMEFALVGLIELLGIGAHGVEADDNIARNLITLGIIEGDDVGVIVVSKELAIAVENTLIVDELVANFAQPLAMELGNLANPGADVTSTNSRHCNALGEK